MHLPNHTENYPHFTIFTHGALVDSSPVALACALTRLSAPPPERCGDNREHQSFTNYDSLSTLYL